MSCTRVFYLDSVEYIEVFVVADDPLDTQPVYFSFDRDMWHEAEWVGAISRRRTARLLVGDIVPLTQSSNVYVRITDLPEAPVTRAGYIEVI